MNTTQERVTLVLPAAVLRRLDALAFAEHRSRSNLATLLLAEALAQRGRVVGTSEPERAAQ